MPERESYRAYRWEPLAPPSNTEIRRTDPNRWSEEVDKEDEDPRASDPIVEGAFVARTEWLNVVTHMAGAVAAAGYAVVRVVMYSSKTQGPFVRTMEWVQIASAAIAALLFCASISYHMNHVNGMNVVASAVLQFIDYAMVFVAIAIFSTADLLVASGGHECGEPRATTPFEELPWQSYLDGPILAGIAVIMLVVVRVSKWPSYTWSLMGYNHGPDRDTRSFRHRFELFETTRYALLTACLFDWICGSWYLVLQLPIPLGVVLVVSKVVGTIIVVLFGINDQLEFTDRLVATFADRQGFACSKSLPQSHVLWHVASILVVCSSLVLRDIAIDVEMRRVVDTCR